MSLGHLIHNLPGACCGMPLFLCFSLTFPGVFGMVSGCEKYEKYERSDEMPGGKHILGKRRQQRVFGTAKVGDRGQIVIPKEARSFFGIEPGDTLLILGDAESGLIISKPEVLDEVAAQIVNNMKKD